MKHLVVLLMVLTLSSYVYSEDAKEIMRRSQNAFLYQADDMKVKVTMRLISSSGAERRRVLTMLRRDVTDGGRQFYYIYFHEPPDVKGMTFMVHKYPDRDDDRWLFIPALNMVKRIAARDRASSFVGSDFTYEDVSGRDIDEDEHQLLRKEVLKGENCLVIKSIPRKEDMPYSYRISWISEKTYLPLKIEYYNHTGKVYKVFTADEVKNIQGYPTVVRRTMRNLQSGHRTEVSFEEVKYNIGLEEGIFTERFLRRPPRSLLR